MTRIAIHLASGFEETEAIVPTDVWRRAGFHVELVSITNNLQVTGGHEITVLADTTFDKTDYSAFDMIFLPGGIPGATNLDNHEGLKNQLKNFADNDKVIGAICAAPLVLGHTNLLKGKKATCFPGFEDELTGAKVTGNPIETDGKIITGTGAGVAMQFALTVVAFFNGQEVSDKLAAKMQVQKD
ncbi:MAG: DJ-1/PfpI family protein [Prolixibacteraceae bacterium]|jgi:4-methyl-5(b-hydroxyethyl)-thiazole monophosphate biosynthesis|nr:DJ-1/PfpI family protein [Prolixibacteraceae bacterium]